jgi:Trypsin
VEILFSLLIEKSRAAKVEIYIGGVNRLALEPNEQYFKTYKYKVHEDYRPSTLANDVALAILEKDVKISCVLSFHYMI